MGLVHLAEALEGVLVSERKAVSVGLMGLRPLKEWLTGLNWECFWMGDVMVGVVNKVEAMALGFGGFESKKELNKCVEESQEID